jgi:exosortase family protein XrtF
MRNDQGIVGKFNPALRFLLIFIGVYVAGNILYGIYIEAYKPQPDPATVWVSFQATAIVNLLGDSSDAIVNDQSPNVLIVKEGKTILRVFEGCNGINVVIVFGSFLLAFGGRTKIMAGYFITGCLVLHAANLLRILLLYYTAIHRPLFFYYFHKYFFTALLYVVVFALWIIWTRIKMGTRGTAQA